ncbi:4Fe-4S dicluster domain-containing protein [Rhodovarius crocodyli]|uniref:4Fe-4S dicluster domain-containing protein n=2 Tax=Rhodovarius crocodyli TaxID=1979269 RepID=A0A437MHM5_9PROT|nr:4Fe-4S dicluster domain-containing protein [Rhodovarius crocodyli]
MEPDLALIRRGCPGVELRGAEHLCRSQLDRFQAALAEGRPITVACTQEAPTFEQEGEEADLTFVNIRENAGWARQGRDASAKMAALLAMAQVPMPATPVVAMESQGVCLVLGRDEVAIDAARRLAETLDITVLLTGQEDVQPASSTPFPILAGRVAQATGWLGAFELVVNGYAAPIPSSRAAYRWGTPRDGARSRCDIVLDLTGGAPLFHETRDGYLRADPANPAAVLEVVLRAQSLIGEFEKPRFVTFTDSLCAHSRNRRTGCSRCLDVCPTGAITPGKDSVAISAEICAGCGSCAAVCPTGAARYALPPAEALGQRIRAGLQAYRRAGGEHPVLLLHAEKGEAMIEALARHGDGLPARVIPVRVNEATQIDLSILAAATAWGAAGLRVLMPARRPEGAEGVLRNIETLNAVTAGLGLGERAAAIETDDPFTLGDALAGLSLKAVWKPDEALAIGAPREVALRSLRALHGASGSAIPALPLPALAGFGAAQVKADGCTLCLACTMVCPVGAFRSNPDAPELSFLEDACVQCGLCAATCPEKVITLEPRLNFAPEAREPRVVKREEPMPCRHCGKPFGTRSSVERVKQKLAASGHWMFTDPKRLAVLELCEDCRAIEATTGGLDPYAGPTRPDTRTTEDYLRDAQRANQETKH